MKIFHGCLFLALQLIDGYLKGFTDTADQTMCGDAALCCHL